VLRIRRSLLSELLAHARREDPRECVGLLLGVGGVAAEAVALENVANRPEVRYRAEPRQLLAALRKAEEAGSQVMAIYHSHPRGPARPSATDLAEASWRVPYVIIGLPAGEVRAFLLPQGEEVELIAV